MSFRLNVTILLTAIFTTACGGYATSPSPTPEAAPAGSTTVMMPGGASVLTTTAFGTNPLNISVGTTISWLNGDSTTHTSTADGGAWSSGNIAPGARFNVTFQSPGQFPYHCLIHPGMTGTIVVQ
jgi:plastocyanin